MSMEGVYPEGARWVFHAAWDTHPLVLTPSGSHQNTYGWQAGGTHPIAMFSCLEWIYGFL